jgi:hypothetical protein
MGSACRSTPNSWSAAGSSGRWSSDFLDARKARLGDVLEDVGTKTLKYLHDFGDGWERTIKVERLIDPEPSILYPRLIEAKGPPPASTRPSRSRCSVSTAIREAHRLMESGEANGKIVVKL